MRTRSPCVMCLITYNGKPQFGEAGFGEGKTGFGEAGFGETGFGEVGGYHCDMVWVNGSNTALSKLFITQKRATRVVS